MYQDYETFNINSFSKDLEGWLKSYISYDYSYFQTVFLKLLNKHASIKKILRFKNNSFM